MNYSKIKYTILSILLVLQVISCKKEDNSHLNGGNGILSFSFSHNPEENVVLKSSAAMDNPVFAVTVKDFETGVIIKSTEDHREFTENPVTLKKGRYIVEATNGTAVNAAFDEPFYSGKDTVEVVGGGDVTSSVTTTLSNVKMSIFMSTSIQNNFTSYDVTVTNKDGGELVYDKEALAKSGFFKCTGILSWKVNLVNNNGEAFEISDDISAVKPREHYKLHFNIDEEGDKNTGGSTITVTFDESMNMKEYDVDISLDKKPAPTFVGDGFDINTLLMVKEDEVTIGNIKINAPEGIKSLVISHTSDVLVGLGLPMSLNIVGLAAELQATINTLGITWTDYMESVDVDLDLSVFFSKLTLGSYTITIGVLDRHAQYIEQALNVTLIPDTEVTTLAVDSWSKYAYLSAQWNTLERPEGVGFQYKKAADAEWQIPRGDVVVSDNNFSMKLQGLEPNTAYQFMAITLNDDSNVIEFTTEGAFPLPNSSFDKWFNPNGKIWYPNEDLSSTNYFWDSGNEGASTLNKNPTTEEKTHVVQGSAVKLTSMFIGVGSLGKFAAGSIYAGEYLETLGMDGGKLSFGRPFTSRPMQLKGHYDYRSGSINYAESEFGGLKGKQDSCHIYVMLTDWDGPFTINTTTQTFINPNDPRIIAFGELKTDQNTGGYKEFVIDLEYRKEGVKPKYLVLVGTSSKYGDYFTGSTSSVLYLDEFEFIY